MTSLRRCLPYLLMAGAALACFAILGRLPVQRVGDGSEYYGLYLAWATDHRPWMTASAYKAYEQLMSLQTIDGLVPRAWFEDAFSALKVGQTEDYNHFWFYSLLAYLSGKLLPFVNLSANPHPAFLMLHSLLLLFVTGLAYRHDGRRGVAIVFLLTFASPMLWFLDKAHTEVFTFSLALSAVILIRSGRHLGGGLCLAIAATQNPSFALIAALPILYRVVVLRKQPYSLIDVCLIVASTLAVFAHPVYYFARYGVVTPQLLTTGASLGANLHYFYIWLIDPDVGLLPNWPLGIAILLAAAGITLSRKQTGAGDSTHFYKVFAIAYLGVNLYAHSATTTLNSGATPGLARYALWYIPLAYPFALMVFDALVERKRLLYAVCLALLGYLYFSVRANDPRSEESYATATDFSRFLQANLPWAYDPPADIFAARQSGMGNIVIVMPIRGVVGPDCRKVLVYPGAERKGFISPGRCGFDVKKLDNVASTLEIPAEKPAYRRLSDQVAASAVLELERGSYDIGAGRPGNFILGEGWSVPEAWGIWSKAKQATINIPCGPHQFFGSQDHFVMTMRMKPFGQQRIAVRAGRDVLWQGELAGPATVVAVTVPARNCRDNVSSLEIDIPGAKSPKALGVSNDKRLLGVGLDQFMIQ